MKHYRWQISLGIILIILSAIVYMIHYIIFRDPHHIFIYLIGDIAFVFINVLLVTLVLNSVLNIREKKEKIQKMNLLIGIFFSEVGTKLLVHFSDADPNLDKIKKDLMVTKNWSENEFTKIKKKLRIYEYNIIIDKIDLELLRNFLINKNDFLILLLENPSLLEQVDFTELLRAVFHLNEELRNRKNVKSLTPADSEHIAGDIKRAYNLLVYQWLDYMQYLKDNYPYLFSLALRLNPFDEKATVEVK
ncbi:MAG: hypothetical protein QHH15_04115 [Candidatus Thermoplasmatota archaeon]|nr:hypothetical protein [Candidatus Thermoplasmatota archaeon]